MPCPSLHHHLDVMSLKLGPEGRACAPQPSHLPASMLGPLLDQRGGPCHPLLHGLDPSGLLGQRPELAASHSACTLSSFVPPPQGLLYLCLATGSTSSGLRLCQIQLLERPFLLKRTATFFPTMNSQGGQTCGWEGRRANHSSQEPLGLVHVISIR